MNDVANAEMWDVEIASGIVRTMTLDELDEAYQNGVIDESTRVRQSGAPNWSTLAAVAGTEDSYTPEPVNSLSPMQVSISVPPPPAVPRELRHLSVAPPDVDDEEEERAFRRSRTKKRLAAAGGIVGVAVLAGLVAFTAARAGSATDALQAAAAAAAMAPPQAAKELPAPADTASDKRSLSEDQKKALLDADKKRQAEAEAKRAKNAPKPRSGQPRSNGKDGLLKSGDKYDPLNGAL